MKPHLQSFILFSFTILLCSCQSTTVSQFHFEDVNSLRNSGLVKTGEVPGEFVDILPPNTKDIHIASYTDRRQCYLQFKLVDLPEDYLSFISRMEGALETDVKKLEMLHPEGVEWWNENFVNTCLDESLFVFRRLPIDGTCSVLVGAMRKGEVYAWIDRQAE